MIAQADNSVLTVHFIYVYYVLRQCMWVALEWCLPERQVRACISVKDRVWTRCRATPTDFSTRVPLFAKNDLSGADVSESEDT